ncbi:hypothetical protein VaNZ11_005830 [Volvox africanus]|uniref:F-box domain-containing protein n=1 Tax=Volvox africanus TaxID=51714 RepID=A0ABQ5RZB4_9CHLO|nr:hypothetical protein VaNZ11_005830 [Volvox africanus]
MHTAYWLKQFFSCFGTPPEGAPNYRAIPGPEKEKFVQSPTNHFEAPYTRVFEPFPILWAYLSRSERLAFRACCRDSRRIHDSLVTDLYVCDDSAVLSEVPAGRLPRSPLPVCHATAHGITTALRGLAERGCKPHLLLLCLAEGHERRRLEEGIAALSALANAASKLSVVHLCGVPLTPQTARAMKNLLASSELSIQMDMPVQRRLGTASLPVVQGPSAAPSLTSICSMPTHPTLTVAAPRPPPPALPLHLNLYGYDLVRQPAAVAVEMLFLAVAPRLTHLELWGCVGWPSRLSTLLHTCLHMQHFSVSFHQLMPPDSAAATAATSKGLVQRRGPATPVASPLARTSAALATGAIVAFPPIAAASTAAGAVKAIGGMHHLRSLELRGFIVNMTRRTSCDNVGRCTSSRPSATLKAAAERAAIASAAPSVQQLAAALYQLTNLTRLSIDGLNSASPLLTAVAAMRGLRQLELPDAAVPTATDLAAITRAAPRLVALTLGSLGPGTVIDAGASLCTAAATAALGELPLPPLLVTLRVARCRPTLRTMRSLVRTVEGRAPPPAALTETDPSGGAGHSSPTRLALVVPGIDIDMLDVEFDALQGFSRGSDGIMRSTLLPESAEALAAAIRVLAPPSSQMLGKGLATNSLSGFGAMASPSVIEPGGAGAGAGRISSSSYGLGASSSFGGGFSCSLATNGGDRDDGIGTMDLCNGRDGDEAEWASAFGYTITRELTIHNSQGSLCPPSTAQLAPAGPLVPLPVASGLEATPPVAFELDAAAGAGAASGQADGADGEATIDSIQIIATPPLVGHAVWISEMQPLGLTSLELYGIGVLAGDLEAVAELMTLQRLTLASGELEVDALPCLAALPLLEYLELARCALCRHRRADGGGFARPTTSGFIRGSGGDVMARSSFATRQSCASVYDHDGDGSEVRPSGKRALLELCVTAPKLRKVFIVRRMGIVCGTEGTQGPMGAEWVRQRLLAAGPRVRAGRPPPALVAAAAGTAGDVLSIKRASLGRASASSAVPAAAPGAEVELGWPEIKWD